MKYIPPYKNRNDQFSLNTYSEWQKETIFGDPRLEQANERTSKRTNTHTPSQRRQKSRVGTRMLRFPLRLRLGKFKKDTTEAGDELVDGMLALALDSPDSDVGGAVPFDDVDSVLHPGPRLRRHGEHRCLSANRGVEYQKIALTS